ESGTGKQAAREPLQLLQWWMCAPRWIRIRTRMDGRMAGCAITIGVYGWRSPHDTVWCECCSSMKSDEGRSGDD
ncbi:hypothetical protein VOLCADRAFT_67330, partial [Volvox carteri f. nagariensis]